VQKTIQDRTGCAYVAQPRENAEFLDRMDRMERMEKYAGAAPNFGSRILWPRLTGNYGGTLRRCRYN